MTRQLPDPAAALASGRRRAGADGSPAWLRRAVRDVGGERGQLGVSPRGNRPARSRVELVPGQPTVYERVLQHLDHLLAVGVARPEPEDPPLPGSRSCRHRPSPGSRNAGKRSARFPAAVRGESLPLPLPVPRARLLEADPGPGQPVHQKARLTCYSGVRALTLSWPAGTAGDPVGQLAGWTNSASDGTLRYPLRLEVLRSAGGYRFFRGGAASRADTLRPSRSRRVIFAIHNYVSSARSSAGQSSCLLSSGSRVRILPGAPF